MVYQRLAIGVLSSHVSFKNRSSSFTSTPVIPSSSACPSTKLALTSSFSRVDNAEMSPVRRSAFWATLCTFRLEALTWSTSGAWVVELFSRTRDRCLVFRGSYNHDNAQRLLALDDLHDFL